MSPALFLCAQQLRKAYHLLLGLCYYDNLSSDSVPWRHWLHVIPSPLAELSMWVLWATLP